jgi:hypothetical protein
VFEALLERLAVAQAAGDIGLVFNIKE